MARLGIATLVVALIGVTALASSGATAATATAGHPLDCTQLAVHGGRRAVEPADRVRSQQLQAHESAAIRRSPRRPISSAGRRAPPSTSRGASPAAGRTCGSRCSTPGSSGATPARCATSPTAAYLNRGEVTPPCSVPSGDCNGDGRFSIADFGAIPDLNGNGLADPEDLILNPSTRTAVDDDHNGYVDDISGWDFLFGDNDPLDTVNYGHGTGEAEDSTAADNGTGDVGTCPQCTFIPVRVGDSFIADGGALRRGRAVRARLRRRGRPGGARRDQQPAPGAARDRRRVPPRRAGDRVDGRRSLEAPQPAGLARAHVDRELRDRQPPTRSDELSRAQRVHQLRRPDVPLDPVRVVLLRGDRDHERRHRPGGERGAGQGAHAHRRTRSCSWSGPTPTTSTSRRRTRSTPPTTSSPGLDGPLSDRARGGTRPTGTAASTPTSC